jgi:Transposase, Mutator family
MKSGVKYNKFVFMSDRHPGLKKALKLHFPDNHQCYCEVHIRGNVKTLFNRLCSDAIINMATSFSVQQVEFYHRQLIKLQNGQETASKYVRDVGDSHWLRIAWMEDPSLPKRYGITSTNMSESASNMLKTNMMSASSSKRTSWLDTLDFIVKKITYRITTLREEHKGKSGVVDHVLDAVTINWNSCANFTVMDIHDNGVEFTVDKKMMSKIQLLTILIWNK